MDKKEGIATIMNLQYSYGRLFKNYYYSYSYEIDGQIFTREKCKFSQIYNKGDIIKIQYNANNISESIAEGEEDVLIGTIFANFLAIVLVIGFIIYICTNI